MTDIQPEQTNRRSWKRTAGWVLLALAALIIYIAVAGGDETTADIPDPEPAAAEPAADEDVPDETTAAVMAEQFVKDQLKSPSTAKFPGPWDYTIERTGANGRTFIQRSHVDSHNGFGAEIRTRYVAKVRYMGDDEWRLVNLRFLD